MGDSFPNRTRAFLAEVQQLFAEGPGGPSIAWRRSEQKLQHNAGPGIAGNVVFRKGECQEIGKPLRAWERKQADERQRPGVTQRRYGTSR